MGNSMKKRYDFPDAPPVAIQSRGNYKKDSSHYEQEFGIIPADVVEVVDGRHRGLPKHMRPELLLPDDIDDDLVKGSHSYTSSGYSPTPVHNGNTYDNHSELNQNVTTEMRQSEVREFFDTNEHSDNNDKEMITTSSTVVVSSIEDKPEKDSQQFEHSDDFDVDKKSGDEEHDNNNTPGLNSSAHSSQEHLAVVDDLDNQDTFQYSQDVPNTDEHNAEEHSLSNQENETEALDSNTPYDSHFANSHDNEVSYVHDSTHHESDVNKSATDVYSSGDHQFGQDVHQPTDDFAF